MPIFRVIKSLKSRLIVVLSLLLVTLLLPFFKFPTVFLLVVIIVIFVLLVQIILTLAFSVQEILKGLSEVSNGNLSFRIPLKSKDEFGEIAQTLNTAISKLERNTLLHKDQINTAINQLTYQNRFLAAIRRLDEAALSTIEIESLAQALVDTASRELRAPFSGIAIVEEEFNQLRRIAISGYDAQMMREIFNIIPIPYNKQTISLDRTDNLIIKVIQEKKLAVTADLYDVQKGIFTQDISIRLQKLLQERMNYKEIFIYPLITKNKVLGVIYFALSKTRQEVSREELSIMENFTKEVTTVIENAILYKVLSKDKMLISAERKKLAVTISAITDGVIAVSLDRKIIIFNNAAEKLTGYLLADVLGKTIDDVIKVFDGDLEVMPLNYCPIGIGNKEGVVFRKSGLKIIGKKEAFVNLIAGQIPEGLENNLGCILTLHDVTEEQELEKMKLDFVSMAAHELRTPLTAIKGYLYLYLKEYESTLDKKQNSILQRINISAQRLSALIENLLNISKIEKGNFTLNLVPVDWIKSINLLLRELNEEAKDKGVEITISLPDEALPRVYVDSLRINEVMSNLLSNAIHYTNSGGKIKISVERKGSEIITHVADTGQGIPEEAIPHLFTKFFKISGPLEQGSKGTGLGLYIAKSIIDMHHGRIWVESKLGQGSTFSFSLPVYTGGFLPNS